MLLDPWRSAVGPWPWRLHKAPSLPGRA